MPDTVSESLLSNDHAEVDVLFDDALRHIENGDPATAFDAVDLFWARLAVHIRAEHLCLFPAVMKISENERLTDIRDTVERLRGDHDFFMHELAKIVKDLRAITPEREAAVINHAAGVLRTIRDRLIEHNAIEEKLVYPLANGLPHDEREQLMSSIAKELANLPPRFQNVFARVQETE